MLVYLYFYLQPIFYFFSSKDPSKNNYYDRVYLCIEKENSKKNNKIKGFHCYQCKNIEEAKSEYYKKFSEKFARIYGLNFRVFELIAFSDFGKFL